MFKTDYREILKQIDAIDPVSYGRNRNYVDGSVTRLSPYISRGIISTQFVLGKVLEKGVEINQIEKFIQELAWRDYWQQIWVDKGELINKNLKHPQEEVEHSGIPTALLKAETNIHVVDKAIMELYETGYMHNHMRMYVAAIACNQGKSYWKYPAHWMYYHLLDGDWASNALSWQWVAGTNSNRKYIANQENINKYFYSNQKGTFLDTSYEALSKLSQPQELKETKQAVLETNLPQANDLKINKALPIALYNYYNLDPIWRKDESMNRVLLLEPSVFSSYPVARKNIDFMLTLADNIPNIQWFVGEFNELADQYSDQPFYYKEHPLNTYRGIEDERDWMFNVKGYFPSFFSFWKKCKKELKHYEK